VTRVVRPESPAPVGAVAPAVPDAPETRGTARRPLLSVVVPLFNEAAGVEELCRRLHAALASLDPYEIILVDDGSADDTRARVRAAHARDPRVKAVCLSRNFGHQVALSAGLDRARGAWTVMMDGDLQDPPELIPALVAKAREGFDVVYATKRSRQENAARRALFRAFHAILHRTADIDVPEGAGNLSLMSDRVVRALRAMPERARYLSGLRAWVGFPQAGIEFDREARYDLRPRMSVSRLFSLAVDAIFGFSRLPLRVALWGGVLASTISLGVGVWVLYQRLFTENAILGWASTLVSMHLIGGLILITLAIIGEYVGRIYDEVKSRPLYLVHEELGFDDA
jgi:polyisoprenyl-phosphate glycosyltransferase